MTVSPPLMPLALMTTGGHPVALQVTSTPSCWWWWRGGDGGGVVMRLIMVGLYDDSIEHEQEQAEEMR